MLYHLTEYLKAAGADIPGMGLFSYLSFRAIAAFSFALLISIFAGRRIIAWLQKKQIGETIRDLGLEGQMQKKGTPTMGGIIIFVSLIIPVLLVSDLSNIYNILLIISTVWFFLVGFADDYIKVAKKRSLGLTPWQKIAGQVFIAVGYGLEGAIPDAYAKRIIDNELIPSFMLGDYYTGVESACQVLMKLASGEISDPGESDEVSEVLSLIMFISLIGLIIILLLIFSNSHGNHGGSGGNGGRSIYIGPVITTGRSYGGGFSSGGGFGGFGGGSFGGGGAGGSW